MVRGTDNPAALDGDIGQGERMDGALLRLIVLDQWAFGLRRFIVYTIGLEGAEACWINIGIGTMPISRFILSAAIILSTAFAAAASDGLPRIDIQKHCSSRANALAGLDSTAGNARDACVRAEQAARDALTAAWKDIPPFYKTSCIKPGDYSPSYEEWIACLEMNIDVKNLRARK